MSEMLERAAKELWDAYPYGPERPFSWGNNSSSTEASVRHAARATILAALDPEDEALLKALADAPTFGKLDLIDAKVIVGLIRAHAQGERTGD